MHKIVITMGDPGGIGPEVIVKALSSEEIKGICCPIVIGSSEIMEEAVRIAGVKDKVVTLTALSDSEPSEGRIEVLDIMEKKSFKKGGSSAEAGKAVEGYVKKAVEIALKNDVGSIVTAPISKESLGMAGLKWPGHTELLAELTGTAEYAMMFVSDRLKVLLSTIHVPLRVVPEMINKDTVFRSISLAEKGMKMLGIKAPRIAVAGLNPHAGEAGIMGDEEIREIIPAVQKARADGLSVSGPYPPDVVFYKTYNGDFDIVVCMYHDQGLIPFKMLAFETGVNMTVGLPVVRTSPDHGTAFDIAWQNRANPLSMIEAIKLAVKVNSQLQSDKCL